MSIDPFTAPGTKVACISDEPDPVLGNNPLRKDAIYTISVWHDETYVGLAEFPDGGFCPGSIWFHRRLLRRIDLPLALTRLLDSTPTRAREVEPA